MCPPPQKKRLIYKEQPKYYRQNFPFKVETTNEQEGQCRTFTFTYKLTMTMIIFELNFLYKRPINTHLLHFNMLESSIVSLRTVPTLWTLHGHTIGVI